MVFGEEAAGFLHNPSLSNSLSVLSLSLPRERSALKDEQFFPVDLMSLVPISTANANNSRPHAKLKDTGLFFYTPRHRNRGMRSLLSFVM